MFCCLCTVGLKEKATDRQRSGIDTIKFHTRPHHGGLDLAVVFTPFTPDRQNKNICAGVLQGTPSFEVE